MLRIQNKVVYWRCGIFALLSALTLYGCAQVDQLKTQVTDKVALEAGDQALAKGDAAGAAAHYRKAAAAGHPQAQYNLGLLSAGDEDSPGNNAEALKWMRLSAEQGYAAAQQTLGTWYFAGDVTPYDPAEAALWFRKAADQHDAAAMYFLGVMHARGEGVSKDHETASGWFQMAAARGFPVPPEHLTREGIAALDREFQATQPAPQPSIQPRPATVRNVQSALTELGYKPGPVDGMMGKKTANAIRAFQRDVNMPVDGNVSDELMRRIQEKLGN